MCSPLAASGEQIRAGRHVFFDSCRKYLVDGCSRCDCSAGPANDKQVRVLHVFFDFLVVIVVG
jgi:hypothetical protein